MLLFLFLSLTSSQGQVWKPEVQFFSIPNSELNSEELTDVFVDREGYVWVITFSSIIKYHGERFKKIKTDHLLHGSFLRMQENSSGTKYVIDFDGAIFLIQENTIIPYKYNQTLRDFNPKNVFFHIDFKPDSSVHFSFEMTGQYNILKPDGKCVGMFQKHNLNLKGRSCILQKDGELPAFFGGNGVWYQSKEKRIGRNRNFHLLNSKWEVIDTLKLPPPRYFLPQSLVQLPNGNFLIATGRGDLLEFNNKEFLRSIYYPDSIVRLFADDDGLWISTEGSGIHYYKDFFIDYSKRVELLSNTTSIVAAKDYQGGVWVYSPDRGDKGLGYIANKNVEYLEGISKLDVGPVMLFKDSIAIGLGNKLHRLPKKGVNPFGGIKTLKLNYEISDLFYNQSSHVLWAAQRNGFSAIFGDNIKYFSLEEKLPFEKGSLTHFSKPNSSSDEFIAQANWQWFKFDYERGIYWHSKTYPFKITGIFKTGKWNLLNTSKGLFEFDDEKVRTFGNKEVFSNSADQIIIRENSLWLSYHSKGVFHYSDGEFTPITVNGRAILQAKLIEEGDKSMWALSPSGSFEIKWNDSSHTYRVLSNQAIPNASISHLTSDQKHIYFTANNKGLGIIKFNDLRETPSQSPIINISKVSVGDQFFYDLDNIGSLRHNKNEIGVWFHCLDYQNSDPIFRYRLSGLNDNWKRTSEGYVNYSSLQPGNYNFQVQSRFGMGEWGEPVQFSFEIKSPIWLRWWFLTLLFSFLGFVVFWNYKRKLRAIKHEKNLMIEKLQAEQRALRTQMNPHFVSNIVSSVQFLILDGAYKSANKFLSLFSSISRKVFNYSSINYISLEEEISLLSDYIQLEEIRIESDFDYIFKIEEEINPKEILIPPFLIQPLVENAILHGLKDKKGGKVVSIDFELSGQYLKVKVSDNGKGISSKEVEKKITDGKEKHGISILEERLSIINDLDKKQNISFELLKNSTGDIAGTEVKILIKYKRREDINNR